MQLLDQIVGNAFHWFLLTISVFLLSCFAAEMSLLLWDKWKRKK